MMDEFRMVLGGILFAGILLMVLGGILFAGILLIILSLVIVI